MDAFGNLTIAGNAQIFDFMLALFNINVFLAVFNVVPLPAAGWFGRFSRVPQPADAVQPAPAGTSMGDGVLLLISSSRTSISSAR